jgi:hypothetical protein
MTAAVLRCSPGIALAGLLAMGCNPDCDDPGRVNGAYTVFSNAASEDWAATGLPPEPPDQAALLGGILANGEGEWALQYTPNAAAYAVEIEGQRFLAEVAEAEEGCNLLVLEMSGVWTSEVGSVHTFTWSGELLWSGERLDGTTTYADTWTWGDLSGTIDIPDGQLRGERQAG